MAFTNPPFGRPSVSHTRSRRLQTLGALFLASCRAGEIASAHSNAQTTACPRSRCFPLLNCWPAVTAEKRSLLKEGLCRLVVAGLCPIRLTSVKDILRLFRASLSDQDSSQKYNI